MIEWQLPVPPKIRIFMWLVSHNTILTKDNLVKKGWTGSTQCQFCYHLEYVDHLFILCNLAQQVWFWLEKSQNVIYQWHTWEDLIKFADTLGASDCAGFLIVLSVVVWTLWKHRNDLCFNNSSIKTARNLIPMIKSLCCYWTENLKKKVKDAVDAWLPVIEDVIPIQ